MAIQPISPVDLVDAISVGEARVRSDILAQRQLELQRAHQAIQQQQFAQTKAQQAALAMLENEGKLAQLQLNRQSLAQKASEDAARLAMDKLQFQRNMENDAIKTREAAARFQSMQQFQNDVQRGMTPEEAAAKHIAGLTAGNPSAFSSFIDTRQRGIDQQNAAKLKDARTSAEKTVDEIQKLDAQALGMEQAGNVEGAAKIKEKSDMLRSSLKGFQMETFTDESGKQQFRLGTKGTGGNGEGKVPTAVVSDAMKKLTQYQNASELITKLEKNLRPEDVGAKGLLGEFLVDKTLEQFVPGSANKKRITNRDLLVSVKEGLIREISGDTRFSNQDRIALDKALPSSGAFESYADAMGKLETVKQLIKDRSKNYSEVIKAPVKWAMTPDEIKAATRLDPKDPNYLSREEAIKLLQMHNQLK